MRILTENPKEKGEQNIPNGYIRIPRFIAEGMYSKDLSTRHINQLLHALLVLSTHTGRLMEFQGYKVFCNKGEIFTSLRELSNLTHIHYRMIDRLLYKLKKQGMIETECQHPGQLIRITRYKELTAAQRKKRKETNSTPAGIPEEKTKEQLLREQKILEERNAFIKNNKHKK